MKGRKPFVESSGGAFATSLADYLHEELAGIGINSKRATKVTNHAVTAVVNTFKGENIYISGAPLTEAKHREMLADLKHMTYSEVDKKYGVSSGYTAVIAKRKKSFIKH